MSIQSRFKDESPTKTVEKIQALLLSYGIETVEEWSESGVRNCFSCRVTVKGTSFGANGKGINKEFARASGYAEFMERMQSGFLAKRTIREHLINYADELQMEKNELMEQCADFVNSISKGLSDLFFTQIPVDHIRSKCLEPETDETVAIAVPYYNFTKDKITYLPKKALPFFYTTNGLAAGNTLEEACVQSLSEIFERHNVIRYFFGGFTPPSVPDEYLRQFEKPYEIIQNLREHGFEVIIKDCSMGEPYPLVAAVAIDKKSHGYHVHMGSHPVFEIALERSLTEMFQGRNLTSVASMKEFSVSGTKGRSHGELVELLTKGCGKYSMSFFAGKPTYEFKPFADRSHMNNREMLKEFIDYYAQKGHDVYVRDISHLGFQSVSIIVPGISEAFPHNLLEQFPESLYYQRYKNAAFDIDKLNAQQLMDYRLYLNYLLSNHGLAALRIHSLTGMRIGGDLVRTSTYYARILYTYIEWNFNQDNAIRFAKVAATEIDGDASSYLSCLCTYYDYRKAKHDEDMIYAGLSVLYAKETVDAVKYALDHGENPFKNCVVRCDFQSCDSCMARSTCTAAETQKLIAKVRKAVLDFDNSSAFTRIAQLQHQMN